MSPPRLVAFIDLGTNSVRMLIVRINPNHSYNVLSEQKETVRLGADEFADRRLQPEAMDRAANALRHFAEMARRMGAEEIVAVATAATREAANRRVFTEQVRRLAGLEMKVISGREEARLIYLGAAGGIELSGRNALFIDIGGGSTELALGDGREPVFLDSLKLGAIRVSNEFLGDAKDAVDPGLYDAIRRHVRHYGVRAVERLRRLRVDLAVGSSGTIENLAQIEAANFGGDGGRVTAAGLARVTKLLCGLRLAARRKVPGINPNRADIIIGGAAILQTLMEELRLMEVKVTSRGLKDGLLAEYLSRTEIGRQAAELSLRERSVLQFGRSVSFDESHARTVARIALELFDSGLVLDLHRLGPAEREHLYYAGLLHDSGAFLSYHNHHAHSHYFIRNADLLGFTQEELETMAVTALFHRREYPRRQDHREFAAMSDRGREVVLVLCVFLRMAESLDRSHSGVVKKAELKAGAGKTVILEMSADRDCSLEYWGVRRHHKAFAKSFGRELIESCAWVNEPVSAPSRPADPVPSSRRRRLARPKAKPAR